MIGAMLIFTIFALMLHESNVKSTSSPAGIGVRSKDDEHDKSIYFNETEYEYEMEELEGIEDSVDEDSVVFEGTENLESDVLHIRDAPRTYAGPYNEIKPEEKYFIYQTSGGFSNQRWMLAQVLEMARILDRTLVVPMIAQHTNMWGRNWKLSGDKMFPADRLLDFPHMANNGLKVVPLNITVKEFVERWEYPGFETKTSPNWYIYYDANGMARKHHEHKLSETWSSWKSRKEKFIFLAGASAWQMDIVNPNNHHIGIENALDWEWKYTRFSPYFRGLALRFSKKLFGGNYNAMHVRMGDYSYKRDMKELPLRLILRLKKEHFEKTSKNLYIATEPKTKRTLFWRVQKHFDVKYSTDLDKNLLQEFDALFSEHHHDHLRNDILGNIEQMICALGKQFAGTMFSTFSKWIYSMRIPKQRAVLLPETGGR